MDTRLKILSPDRALQVASETHSSGRRLKIVSGYFDVLQPDMVRALASLAEPQTILLALVLDPPSPVTSAGARAELAASLRVIDYVLPSDGDPVAMVQRLQPAEWVQHEREHAAATERLIRHVIDRHSAELARRQTH